MKVAIYCRLSEEDRDKQSAGDDSESIQNQKSMLLHYAFEQGWEVYDIYSDEDYTGADRNRPEFNRLIKDAELRRFEVVLCKLQSRFTREVELVEKYLHTLFPMWGIRFISLVDSADTANKGNKKSRQINGLVNEWYIEDLSENIKSVLLNKRKQGQHLAGIAPYGYLKDPNKKGALIVDEDVAPIIREIFTLFAEGYGKYYIARSLNDRSILSPTEYKITKDIRHKSQNPRQKIYWGDCTITRILKNQMYIGNMVQGKVRSSSYKTKKIKPVPQQEWSIVKDTHEAIISLELWNKVQGRLVDKTKPYNSGQIGLFAKKVRCIECGHTLRAYKNTRQMRYLSCPTRLKSKQLCSGSLIFVNKLERIVIDELNKLLMQFLNQNYIESGLHSKEHTEDHVIKINAQISACRKKIAEFDKGIHDLYLDKVRGVVSESDYMMLRDSFAKEKDQYEAELDKHQKQLSNIESMRQIGNNRKEIAKQYSSISELDRNMVEKLIDYIVVGKRIVGTKNVPIEIHWNF